MEEPMFRGHFGHDLIGKRFVVRTCYEEVTGILEEVREDGIVVEQYQIGWESSPASPRPTIRCIENFVPYNQIVGYSRIH